MVVSKIRLNERGKVAVGTVSHKVLLDKAYKPHAIKINGDAVITNERGQFQWIPACYYEFVTE